MVLGYLGTTRNGCQETLDTLARQQLPGASMTGGITYHIRMQVLPQLLEWLCIWHGVGQSSTAGHNTGACYRPRGFHAVTKWRSRWELRVCSALVDKPFPLPAHVR